MQHGPRAHIHCIRLLPVLRVGFSLSKLESTKCVTVISLNQLCLTSNPHSSCWLASQCQPCLGLAPRAICGLWGSCHCQSLVLSQSEAPATASPLSLETLQRPDSSLEPSPCAHTTNAVPLASPRKPTPPLYSCPSPSGLNKEARKGRLYRNLFYPILP